MPRHVAFRLGVSPTNALMPALRCRGRHRIGDRGARKRRRVPRAAMRTAYTAAMQIRHALPLAFALLAGSVLAQQQQPPQQAASAPAAAGSKIAYPSVAAALKDLESRDGNGTIVTHSEGWTTINEPLASAQWSFAPKGHAAYPSVIRRIIKRGPGGAVSVDTAHLCEAPAAACEQLLAEFAAMNERITQAVKARGRQGSRQPVPLNDDGPKLPQPPETR